MRTSAHMRCLNFRWRVSTLRHCPGPASTFLILRLHTSDWLSKAPTTSIEKTHDQRSREGEKKQEILDHPLFPKPLPYSLLFQLPPVLWRNFTDKWAFAKSSPSSKNAYGCICQHIRKAHILLFSQMPIILGIKWKELGNNLPVVTRAKAAINSRTLQSQPKDCPILTIYRNLQRERECPFAIRYLKSFHFLIKGGCQNSIEGI